MTGRTRNSAAAPELKYAIGRYAIVVAGKVANEPSAAAHLRAIETDRNGHKPIMTAP